MAVTPWKIKGLNGNFPTNPYNKPPYKSFIGIGIVYIIRLSWSLFYHNNRLGKIKSLPEFPGYLFPYFYRGMRTAVFSIGGNDIVI